MKRVICAAYSEKIPSEQEYFDEVRDQDFEVIKYLSTLKGYSGKIITVPTTRNELGKNPNYSAQDKCIHLSADHGDARTYKIPYNGSGRFGSDRIYTFELTVYDDQSFQIGDGKVRTTDTPVSTLSNDVNRARSAW